MNPPETVVVVRGDGLGDTLLATPALQALRRAWPDSRLVVLASPAGAPVLEGLGEVWVVRGGDPPGTLHRRLRSLAPDCALVFTEKRGGYAAAYASKAPLRVGFDPGRTQPLKSIFLRMALTRRVAWSNDPQHDPGLHEVERYLRLVEAAGVPPGKPPPLRVPVDSRAREWARSWMEERFTRPPAAVQLMPRWREQGWPPELPLRVAERLEGPVLFCCAPEHRRLAPPVGHLACFAEPRRWAAVLERCRALITPDGGAAHMAAALGVPVVDLFPERHAAHCVRRWRPWGVPHRVVLRGRWRPGAEVELAEALAQAARELLEPCPAT